MMILVFLLLVVSTKFQGGVTSHQIDESSTRQDIEEIKRTMKADSEHNAHKFDVLEQQMKVKDSEIKNLKDQIATMKTRQVPTTVKDSAKRLVLHSDEDLALKFTELTEKVQSLENTVSKLQSTPASSVDDGTTYVRWGRNVCPANGTELVYKGYVGGSYFNETGGGVNYLCLSDDPIYGHFESGRQPRRAYVYGAEYQLGEGNSASTLAFIHKDLFQDDVPCAVCRTTRSSVLMIPGRNACTAGWTMEYKGYLTSGDTEHIAASEFVCLDENPVEVPHGHDNENGKLFYFAEGRCGSLACPPYVDGQELTCVVCSK